MEALRELEAVYAEWEKQVKDEAYQAGKQSGYRSGIIKSLELLGDAVGIEISDARRAHLATLDIPELKALMTVLSKTRRWPDV